MLAIFLLFRFPSSVEAIFWSLFGQIDRENFKIEEEEYEVIWKTGMIFFGTFNVVAVLVALNMLIAMLNESYNRIAVSDTPDFFSNFAARLRISPRSYHAVYLSGVWWRWTLSCRNTTTPWNCFHMTMTWLDFQIILALWAQIYLNLVLLFFVRPGYMLIVWNLQYVRAISLYSPTF